MHAASYGEGFAERRAATKLNHPNIVQVYDVRVSIPFYIAPELIDGGNLRERLEEHGAIGSEEAIECWWVLPPRWNWLRNRGSPEILSRKHHAVLTGAVKVADFDSQNSNGHVDDANQPNSGRSTLERRVI